MKVYSIHAPTPQGSAARDQQAFLVGVTFHEAALRARITTNDRDGTPVDAVCPMIVCYAFASELYLKSLIPNVMNNHRLDVLYKRIEPKVRNRIAAAYKARTGREHRDLEGDLKKIAGAFVEWRYVFEGAGQQLHTNLLIAFTKALYETIKSHRPEWSVSLPQGERLLAPEETPSMTVANLGGGTFLHVTDGTGGALNIPEA
jgi:hypothetical protein